MRELNSGDLLLRKTEESLTLPSHLVLVLVVLAVLHQKLIVYVEIPFEDLLLEVYFAMPLIGLLSVEEIERELKAEVKHVLLGQRYKVVLSRGDTAGDVDVRDGGARCVGVHLALHVSFEVPREDVVLQGFGLRVHKLDYLRVGGGQDLGDLSMIQV